MRRLMLLLALLLPSTVFAGPCLNVSWTTIDDTTGEVLGVGTGVVCPEPGWGGGGYGEYPGDGGYTDGTDDRENQRRENDARLLEKAQQQCAARASKLGATSFNFDTELKTCVIKIKDLVPPKNECPGSAGTNGTSAMRFTAQAEGGDKKTCTPGPPPNITIPGPIRLPLPSQCNPGGQLAQMEAAVTTMVELFKFATMVSLAQNVSDLLTGGFQMYGDIGSGVLATEDGGAVFSWQTERVGEVLKLSWDRAHDAWYKDLQLSSYDQFAYMAKHPEVQKSQEYLFYELVFQAQPEMTGTQATRIVGGVCKPKP